MERSRDVRGDDRLAAITAKVADNIKGVRYGVVSVSLRVHDGRIVDITHTVTESQKEYPDMSRTGGAL